MTTPAVPDPATPALADTPTSVLAFALGYAVARPQRAEAFGPFCALVEELMARPSGSTDRGPLGGWDQRWEFGVVMSLLPAELSRAVVMLYQAQRGQRWAHTGVTPPRRETNSPEG